jgi:hypothetical protein
LGISLLAALFFRRFDPAPQKLKPTRNTEPIESFPLDNIKSAPVPAPVHLTPLASSKGAFHPTRILLAELRLLFKAIRWWWLIVIFGLNMAGFLLPTDSARQYVLPVAWILPLAIWSSLGTRENRHNTDQLVYSVIVTLISGAGVAVNLMLAGDGLHLVAWGIGVLFIPTLALALGVWSGTNKLFEVVYMLWWYAGPINRMESLDFMGASPNRPLGQMLVYGLFTILLFAFAMVGRNRQLKR